VIDVFRSDWLTTGPRVGKFEEAFGAWVDAEHAVSFGSGTAAVHVAVFADRLTADGEAITSPMTFAATANCVLYMVTTTKCDFAERIPRGRKRLRAADQSIDLPRHDGAGRREHDLRGR